MQNSTTVFPYSTASNCLEMSLNRWTYWSTQPTDKSILFLNVIFNRKKTMHLLLKWKKGKYWGLERKHAQRPWTELNVIENFIRRKKMQEGWGAPSISLNPADSLLQGLVLFVLTNRGFGVSPIQHSRKHEHFLFIISKMKRFKVPKGRCVC